MLVSRIAEEAKKDRNDERGGGAYGHFGTKPTKPGCPLIRSHSAHFLVELNAGVALVRIVGFDARASLLYLRETLKTCKAAPPNGSVPPSFFKWGPAEDFEEGGAEVNKLGAYSPPHLLPFPLPPRGVPSFFKFAGEVGKVGGEARRLGVAGTFAGHFFQNL